MDAEVRRLRSLLHRAGEERQRYFDALERIVEWSKAYPLEVFPEPDFKRAHEVLAAHGITLDAISASCMRHVVEGVGKIAVDAMSDEATVPSEQDIEDLFGGRVEPIVLSPAERQDLERYMSGKTSVSDSKRTLRLAEKEALVELLSQLPALPEAWPGGTVSNAFHRAIEVYENRIEERRLDRGCAILYEMVAEAYDSEWRELIGRIYIAMRDADRTSDAPNSGRP